MKSIILCVVLVVTAALSSHANAGVVFDIETTDHAQSRVVHTKVFAQGKHLKLISTQETEVRSAPPSTMIFDADRRELIIVEDRSKTYSVLDEKSIQAIADRIQAMRFEAGIAPREPIVPKDEPDEPVQPPAAEIKNTGEKMTQHGFETTRHDVYREKKKVSELWVTKWDHIEGGESVSALFSAMAEFMDDMATRLATEGGSASMANGRSNDNVFEYMKELGGFPVVSRVLVEDEVTSESVLRSTKSQDFDAATFQPPEGYTMRSLIAPAPPPQDHSDHDHSRPGH